MSICTEFEIYCSYFSEDPEFGVEDIKSLCCTETMTETELGHPAAAAWIY